MLIETKGPINFEQRVVTTDEKHWHDFHQIIYIISGTLSVQINDMVYQLSEDEIILVNNFEKHALSSKDCRIIEFNLYTSGFLDTTVYNGLLTFDCNSRTVSSDDSLNPIKQILAKVIKVSLNNEEGHHLMLYSYAYLLFSKLVNYFRVDRKLVYNANRSSMATLEQVITYINSHFKDRLNLKFLADKFYISAPHLSKIFKEFMEVGYKEYIDELRLTSAVRHISNPDLTLAEIAENNGFNNSRSFSAVFKKKYGMLPNEYRTQIVEEKTSSKKLKKTINTSALDMQHHSYLGNLAKYLDDDKQESKEVSERLVIDEVPPISFSYNGKKLTHNFKNIMCLGKAKHILYGNNQKMITQLQADIGFKYIKFHGLIDDDMMVYSEDKDGKPSLNFAYIDMVFDFLDSVHLKPFIELSFMPKQLAQTTSRTLYYSESYISLPKDYDKWTYLVQELFTHLDVRYGRSEVESWPIILWNKPDSPTSLFGFEKDDDFFYFYKKTHEAIKGYNNALQFGSPSFMSDSIESGTWINAFFDYCHANNCEPDFFNYHFYPISLATDINDVEIISTSKIVLLESENAMKENIKTLKENADSYNWILSKTYITEWNSTISHRDLLNDTAFKATYIVKNILDNYDEVDGFGYNFLSDLVEEVKMTGNLFHGGLGLFTNNGIKKAAYYGFQLLNKLGTHLVKKGDGYFVTKTSTSYQIILYNYQHFSKLYASGELFNMTFNSRYTPFVNARRKKMIVTFSDVTTGKFIATDTVVNRYNGSPFDQWVEMGAMKLDSQREVDYLKSVSIPLIKKQTLVSKNGFLHISRVLEPHEVRLIDITPIKPIRQKLSPPNEVKDEK